MSKRNLQQQRERMWREDPRCRYCGVETILRPHHSKDELRDLSTADRYRLATIDHVRPRHHPGRLEPYRKGQEPPRHILSCWKCNNDRDRDELRAKPREFFYQNGGAMPLILRSLSDLYGILNKLGSSRVSKYRCTRNRFYASITTIEREIAWREFEGEFYAPEPNKQDPKESDSVLEAWQTQGTSEYFNRTEQEAQASAY